MTAEQRPGLLLIKYGVILISAAIISASISQFRVTINKCPAPTEQSK